MARYNLHDYLTDQHQWLDVWIEHLEKIVGRPLIPYYKLQPISVINPIKST